MVVCEEHWNVLRCVLHAEDMFDTERRDRS